MVTISNDFLLQMTNQNVYNFWAKTSMISDNKARKYFCRIEKVFHTKKVIGDNSKMLYK